MNACILTPNAAKANRRQLGMLFTFCILPDITYNIESSVVSLYNNKECIVVETRAERLLESQQVS